MERVTWPIQDEQIVVGIVVAAGMTSDKVVAGRRDAAAQGIVGYTVDSFCFCVCLFIAGWQDNGWSRATESPRWKSKEAEVDVMMMLTVVGRKRSCRVVHEEGKKAKKVEVKKKEMFSKVKEENKK